MGDYEKPTLSKGDGKVIVKVRLHSLYQVARSRDRREEKNPD